MESDMKGYLFLFCVFILTFFVTYVLAGMIVFEDGNVLFPLIWLVGFCVLIVNVCLALVQAVFFILSGKHLLPELKPAKNPLTAVVYPLKDETFGMYERIKYTIEQNRIENTHFWILSDSGRDSLDYENELVLKLRKDFGSEIIRYRKRKEPIEKKQGNISDWIKNFGSSYEYMIVCDADSVLPKGSVQKFINKAEHPANSDVAIFQGGIRVIHAKTLFSRFIALATESSQKFNVTLMWRIFERSMSVGHGNLIRIKPFSKVKLRNGIICHDFWETAYLDKMGYRTCYCEDIISYEEVPTNYLEIRRRDKRWARGTIQAWPLLFLNGISLGTRFNVGYCIYSYFAHMMLLLWLIGGFFCSSSLGGQLLTFQRYAFIGYSMIDLELSAMLIGTLLIMAFHKIVTCRSIRDIINLIAEVIFSTLVALNNIFYVTLDLISIPFKKAGWRPMAKNPFESPTLLQTAKALLPGTLFGIFCIFLGLKYSVHWLMVSLPFIISFVGAIPLVYLTSTRGE